MNQMKINDLKPAHFLALLLWINFLCIVWGFVTEAIKINPFNISTSIIFFILAIFASAVASNKDGK